MSGLSCGIITPVGPGHETLFVERCKPSIERAMAYARGPFESVHLFAMDDTQGRFGRSRRRNQAIAAAQEQGIDWLFFLDADDTLAASAFDAFGRCIAAEPALDALWGLICEEGSEGALHLRDGQPERIDSYAEFLATPPYQAVQIGHFVRTEVIADFGFDETMDTGEDYKLYCQLWARGRCAKRPEIFFVNHRGQHSTGPRSATGRDWRATVDRLWADRVAAKPLWAEVSDHGISARMRVNNPLDLIQGRHLEGRFFEQEPLNRLRRLVKPGARIVEVGANIGNHLVWYAQHLAPAKIYPVEPNPAAIALLHDNIAANGLGGVVDPRGIGLGAGRAHARMRAETADPDNLGATSLVADDSGGLEVESLDRLLAGERADFIKIDAEGMELEVLAGAADLIARSRPLIWIEVRRENALSFAQRWCRGNDYCLIDSVAYRNTIDYFAQPRECA